MYGNIYVNIYWWQMCVKKKKSWKKYLSERLWPSVWFFFFTLQSKKKDRESFSTNELKLEDEWGNHSDRGTQNLDFCIKVVDNKPAQALDKWGVLRHLIMWCFFFFTDCGMTGLSIPLILVWFWDWASVQHWMHQRRRHVLECSGCNAHVL